ncbi:ExeA family protein [Pseudomonas fluvialis]|jgi:MSHA biogenesis protein MshM|uniref:ExeA family protein n=1 Tax=Pseudomonas fluvialis TaxID=1793966 RepID=UPI0035AF6806
MYEAFFGLREKPFALTPNTEFLVQLAPYQGCLNLLRLALAEGEGFIKVIGEVGTGKTLLCRAVLNLLDKRRFQAAYLPNPCLTPLALRQALAHELHLQDTAELDEHSLLQRINQRLIELAAAGKSTVLLIDEAQALPPRTLESLRLLTNLEGERSKLLQVVLFAQPELDSTLQQEAFRQLRQRITFSYSLRPLDLVDIRRYLQERLAVAGYRGEPLFSEAALRRLARGSGGIPRLLNILANKALMAAFGEGCRQIGAVHVQRAIADTEGAVRGGALRPGLRGLLLCLAALLALLAGSWLALRGWPNVAEWLP